MHDSPNIAALIAGLMVPLLALAVVLGSTAILIAAIVLALIALFFTGRALGREGRLRSPGG